MIDGGWRGEGAILFGGSGFTGGAVLRLFPAMISAGRTPPDAPNRHIHVPALDQLGALDGVSFDRVILCTGTSRHVELMRKAGDEAALFHVRPTLDVLQALRERAIRSVVRLSTVLLYDDARGTLPVTEQSPIDPARNRYLQSQYDGECAAETMQVVAPIATLRLCNLYGPSRAERTDLIHQTIQQLKRSGRGSIRNRAPERDFVFVDDAARAIGALSLVEQRGVFVLGSGVATSCGQIADILSAESGCPVTSLEEPVDGIASIRVDSAKLRAATGWTPEYTIEEGLRKTWKDWDAPRY